MFYAGRSYQCTQEPDHYLGGETIVSSFLSPKCIDRGLDDDMLDWKFEVNNESARIGEHIQEARTSVPYEEVLNSKISILETEHR